MKIKSGVEKERDWCFFIFIFLFFLTSVQQSPEYHQIAPS